MTVRVILYALVVLFSVGLPVGAAIVLKRRLGARLWPFFAGAICFTVFAMGLEQVAHTFCLVRDDPVSRVILGSTPLYALYAAFAAGIFEETGRLFAFKVLLRGHREPKSAVMYGLGHGGIEVVYIVGLPYAVYLLGLLGVSFGSPEADAMITGTAMGISLSAVPIACLERVIAMSIHVGLSLIVFRAVTENKLRYYLYAVLIHAAIDLPAAFCQQGMLPVWAIELWSACLAAAVLAWGIRLSKRNA